jgi:hypothetical protein
MAPNPPAGANIDYVVDGPAAGRVVIRIVDAQERTVRAYGSEDRLPATDLAKIRVAPEWAAAPSAPPTTPGMHRFVWPIRYPAPAALRDGNPYADGCGRLPAATRSSSRSAPPAHPAPDHPARSARDDDGRALCAQFALARRIEASSARVAAAVTAADAIHKRLAADGPSDLDLRVQALLGPDFGSAPAAPPPPGLVPLRTLAGKLARFLDAVDGADAPPSPDAEAGFAQIEPVVDAALTAWTALQAQVPSAP